ncbi:hypothetical protein FNV43_RR17477 [Rhamnella rubrinervis]|uniref:NAB domain-containing protein n=1 Tax=Rhamnella rubrinervis TaxID=2594499 RepID=A0A8K0DX61_9ROSA|nr:hypothetical protein FNV43_RR17477 [Rhamnella rubrinervis]
MEEKVQNTLKLIEEDGDSFAKRAEMYYKKRPELINFVEESYRAYRSLAERYDHISTELQNANNTIATIFPEQVQFAMDEEDEYASPRFPRKVSEVPRTDIPKVPKGPMKDLRSVITTATATKKFLPKKTPKPAFTKTGKTAPTSGLSKTQALDDIDRFQKQILSLQTEKEFVKSSYENGLAKYWEIEKQIKELQEKVCKLQDEYGEGMVIEDDEARSLMATAALKSCQETLAQLQEKQERSAEEAEVESQRIKSVREKLEYFKDKFNCNQVSEQNQKGKVQPAKAVENLNLLEQEVSSATKKRQELELLREKIKQHFEVGSNLTVTEMAEKIDELVNKVVNLETAISSQTALVKRLQNETDELQAQIQTLEDDKANLIDGKKTLSHKVQEMEEKLQGIQDLNQSFRDQNNHLQTHFTEAHCNLDHLSEKLQSVQPDEELEVTSSSQKEAGSPSEAKLQKQFEGQEVVPNPLEGSKTLLGEKSDEELKVSVPLQKEEESPGEVRLFEELEKQDAVTNMSNGSSPAAPNMGNVSASAEVRSLLESNEQEVAPNMGNVLSPAEVRFKEQEAATILGNVSSPAEVRLLEESKDQEAASNIGTVSVLADVRLFEELKEQEAAPNMGNVSSPAEVRSLEEMKEEAAPNMGNVSSPGEVRSLEELKEQAAVPNIGNVSDLADVRLFEELKEQGAEPYMGNGSSPDEVRYLEALKEQKVAPNMAKGSGEVKESLSTSAGDQQENVDSELLNVSDKQTSLQTLDDLLNVKKQERATEEEDEPDWRQMFLNGMENREKVILTEYTTTLRNYKDVKKKLNEVEKKAQDSLFETSVQLKELKSSNVKKDEEIRSLRLKLGLLQQSLEDTNSNDFNKMENPTPPSTEETEDIKAILNDQSCAEMSAIEEKFRMSIDELLEENLGFWLKFSTSFHKIQQFETEVKDLLSEMSKLEDKRKSQEGSSTLKHLLKSDARPLYKHLREIQTELTVWLEKSVLLKDEMQCRFASLCNIQEEITQALKTSAEDDDFKFTSYQAAKFQGEVLNMKQENNKVADELQAALDHVTTLQLEVDKALAALNEEFALSGSRKQQEPQLRHSESRSRVPLRSFIFGTKPKKQKSIFSCMTPAMHRKYHGLRAGPPL